MANGAIHESFGAMPDRFTARLIQLKASPQKASPARSSTEPYTNTAQKLETLCSSIFVWPTDLIIAALCGSRRIMVHAIHYLHLLACINLVASEAITYVALPAESYAVTIKDPPTPSDGEIIVQTDSASFGDVIPCPITSTKGDATYRIRRAIECGLDELHDRN